MDQEGQVPAQAPAPAANSQGPMTTALFGPSGPGAAKKPAPAAPSTSEETGDSTSLPPTPAPVSGAPPANFWSDLQAHMQGIVDNLPASTTQMGPNPPPAPFMSPPPTPPSFNPAHAWGSTAMVLAMVGSMLTRHPLTAALNAGSQVMKAYHDQNQEAADQAFSVWQAQNANALNLAKYELDVYIATVKNNQGDDKALTAALLADATATKNSGMLAANDAGGLNGMMDYIEKMGRATASMAGQSERLVTMQLENQAWNEWNTENPKPTDPAQMPAWTQQALAARKSIFSASASAGDGTPLPTLPTDTPPPTAPTPGAPTGTVPGPTGAPIPAPAGANAPVPVPASIDLNKAATQDPSLYATAYKMAHYDIAPPSSFELTKPENEKLMQLVTAINPGYDATNYAPIIKVKEDFDSGTSSKSVRSFNVMVSHLKTLNTLATALNNNDVQSINRISNIFGQQFGKSAPTSFAAAKRIVSDEIVKAVTGAAGALGDREEAQNTLDSANTPAQLAGVINTYMQLAAGQLAGYRQEYQVGTGLNDFNKYLSPDTIQTLGSVSISDIPDTPGSAAPSAPSGGGDWGIQQVP